MKKDSIFFTTTMKTITEKKRGDGYPLLLFKDESDSDKFSHSRKGDPHRSKMYESSSLEILWQHPKIWFASQQNDQLFGYFQSINIELFQTIPSLFT